MEKPLDWNPLKEGKQVALDHDYRRPGTSSGGGPAAKPRAIDDKVHRGPKEGLTGSRRAMDLRVNGEDKSGVWPGRGPKSSLCKGAGACDELERVMYAGDDGSGTPDAEEDSDGVGESAPSATTPSAEPERPPETGSPHEAGSSEGEVKPAEPAIPALPAPGKSVASPRSTLSHGSSPSFKKVTIP